MGGFVFILYQLWEKCCLDT